MGSKSDSVSMDRLKPFSMISSQFQLLHIDAGKTTVEGSKRCLLVWKFSLPNQIYLYKISYK